MKKYWFKAKTFGWGWQPASKEGWTVILLYLAVLGFLFLRIDRSAHSISDSLFQFLPLAIVFTCMLLFVCYKTGERPTWRWGKKRRNQNEKS